MVILIISTKSMYGAFVFILFDHRKKIVQKTGQHKDSEYYFFLFPKKWRGYFLFCILYWRFSTGHFIYNFIPSPAKDQLQVSQGNVFATNTQHEFEPSENLGNFSVSEGANNGVPLEWKLGLFDPWAIKKRLTFSDINGKNSRLLLPKGLVEEHILSQWDARCIENIKNNGVRVAVWDCDTDCEHQLLFKQWGNGSPVLFGNWIMGFVRRRDLKEGDEIGLYWDQSSSRFSFCLLKQASSN